MKAAAELLRENLPGLIYPNEADNLVVQWKGNNYDQEGGNREALEVFRKMGTKSRTHGSWQGNGIATPRAEQCK